MTGSNNLMAYLSRFGVLSGYMLYLRTKLGGGVRSIAVPGMENPIYMRTGTSDRSAFNEVIVKRWYDHPFPGGEPRSGARGEVLQRTIGASRARIVGGRARGGVQESRRLARAVAANDCSRFGRSHRLEDAIDKPCLDVKENVLHRLLGRLRIGVHGAELLMARPPFLAVDGNPEKHQPDGAGGDVH